MPSAVQLRSGAPCQPSMQVPRTPVVIESDCGQLALSDTTALQRRRVHVPMAASHEPLALHLRVGWVENPKPSTQDPDAVEPGSVEGHTTLSMVSAGHAYSKKIITVLIAATNTSDAHVRRRRKSAARHHRTSKSATLCRKSLPCTFQTQSHRRASPANRHRPPNARCTASAYTDLKPSPIGL